MRDVAERRQKPIERTNPRFDARVRTRKGDEGPVRDDIAGESARVRLSTNATVSSRACARVGVPAPAATAPGCRRDRDAGVFAVEDDVAALAELRAVEQLLHRRRTARKRLRQGEAEFVDVLPLGAGANQGDGGRKRRLAERVFGMKVRADDVDRRMGADLASSRATVWPLRNPIPVSTTSGARSDDEA